MHSCSSLWCYGLVQFPFPPFPCTPPPHLQQEEKTPRLPDKKKNHHTNGWTRKKNNSESNWVKLKRKHDNGTKQSTTQAYVHAHLTN